MTRYLAPMQVGALRMYMCSRGPDDLEVGELSAEPLQVRYLQPAPEHRQGLEVHQTFGLSGKKKEKKKEEDKKASGKGKKEHTIDKVKRGGSRYNRPRVDLRSQAQNKAKKL